jgi:type VI secretion system protein ImpE
MTQPNPEDLLRQGEPAAALDALQQLIRKEPQDAKHRVFLFQLLVTTGQWERAKTQLSVVRELDAATIPMAQTYSEALRCEVLRERVFSGQRSPLLFGEPAEWVAHVLQALMLSAEGNVEHAQRLRGSALEEAEATGGTLTIASEDGDREVAFEWLADADSRIGPVFEAVINGKYYWVPSSAVSEVRIDPPEDLRDVVWMPAQFRWRNGGEAVALIPTRYPGSAQAEDPAFQLARRTEWQDCGHDEFRGLGQRVFATDAGDFGLCDVRRIAYESTE